MVRDALRYESRGRAARREYTTPTDHDAELNSSATPARSPARLVWKTSEPINSATPTVPVTSPNNDLPVGFTFGGTTAPSSAMMIASVDINSAAKPEGTRFSAQ